MPEQWTLPRSECRVLASGTLPVLLDHATLLRLRAEHGARRASNPGVPERPSGLTFEGAEFTVLLASGLNENFDQRRRTGVGCEAPRGFLARSYGLPAEVNAYLGAGATRARASPISRRLACPALVGVREGARFLKTQEPSNVSDRKASITQITFSEIGPHFIEHLCKGNALRLQAAETRSEN